MAIDYSKWLKKPHWEVWELRYLLMEIDPDEAPGAIEIDFDTGEERPASAPIEAIAKAAVRWQKVGNEARLRMAAQQPKLGFVFDGKALFNPRPTLVYLQRQGVALPPPLKHALKDSISRRGRSPTLPTLIPKIERAAKLFFDSHTNLAAWPATKVYVHKDFLREAFQFDHHFQKTDSESQCDFVARYRTQFKISARTARNTITAVAKGLQKKIDR